MPRIAIRLSSLTTLIQPRLISSLNLLRLFFGLACLLVSNAQAASVAKSGYSETQLSEFRAHIQQMKQESRGPFQRIRWFCADGTVLPPKAYACRDHGGGRQHGQWSDATKELRDNGFYIANVLAAVDPVELIKELTPTSELSAILLEHYLIEVDNGWILRKAKFYRGAFQIEQEQEQAKKIMQALLANSTVLDNNFLLAVEAYNRLPGVSSDSNLLDKVRSDAIVVQQKQPEFQPLRNKIHGRLEASDAKAVRQFAEQQRNSEQYQFIIELADNIELIFDDPTLPWPANQKPSQELIDLVRQFDGLDIDKQWHDSTELRDQIYTLGTISSALRNKIVSKELSNNLKQKQQLFSHVSRIERNQFILGRTLLGQTESLSRRDLLKLLAALTGSLYGSGFISEVEQQQIQGIIATTLNNSNQTLADYRDALKELAKTPVWSGQRARFSFQAQAERFALLEHQALEFIPNRLRGSPLLVYGELLNHLNDDVAQLSGVQHRYFSDSKSGGLRVLNAGAASGFLHTPESLTKLQTPPTDVILQVPETLADLPAVTGILTAFEGNQLSHVQLLARNLGIPNIVVSDDLLPELDQHIGKWVEVYASSGGVVDIQLKEKPKQSEIQKDQTSADQEVLIKVDLDKLDLTQRLAISTKDLDASASGVSVGPKAAKVAQLSKQFPGKVSPALALPFGSFRQLLENNTHNSGTPMFDWIKQQYAQMDTLSGDELNKFRTEFLAELRQWFNEVEIDPEFVADLKQKMEAEFGKEGSYGVFIRSDTNVEDLPGFTGAGLNLTLPNVVGFDDVIAGIRQVWASPFTERAFGWRQARMDKPEHVYTAILLHKTVPSDFSGVLATKDIFDNKEGKLSVVVNEGVGGGVDGLAAEALVIDTNTGDALRYASATAAYKRIVLNQGGSKLVAASGKSVLLEPQHIQQIIEFSEQVGSWFSDQQGAIADVEFGFYNDEFVLFQIRPLVESEIGLNHPRLLELDAKLSANNQTLVNLDQKP